MQEKAQLNRVWDPTAGEHTCSAWVVERLRFNNIRVKSELYSHIITNTRNLYQYDQTNITSPLHGGAETMLCGEQWCLPLLPGINFRKCYLY